ncbi:hypothetical protein G6F46_014909 [Rhizopus delemar]|nr:hypothetical protein G6F46_014909 [Rhizopus delemar]
MAVGFPLPPAAIASDFAAGEPRSDRGRIPFVHERALTPDPGARERPDTRPGPPSLPRRSCKESGTAVPALYVSGATATAIIRMAGGCLMPTRAGALAPSTLGTCA